VNRFATAHRVGIDLFLNPARLFKRTHLRIGEGPLGGLRIAASSQQNHNTDHHYAHGYILRLKLINDDRG
ncbi:MAG: hypothetical protein AABY62_11230, partial [Pseudomonadota bacterium]